MILSQKLVELRKENNLSQFELAEKLSVSRQAVSRWEVGLAAPSTENLRTLSTLYGVSLDYLLSDDKEKKMPMDEADKHIDENDDNKLPQKSLKNQKKVIGIVVLCIATMVIIACAIVFGENTLYNCYVSGKVIACDASTNSFVVQSDGLRENNQVFYVFSVDDDTVLWDFSNNVLTFDDIMINMNVEVMYHTRGPEGTTSYEVQSAEIKLCGY